MGSASLVGMTEKRISQLLDMMVNHVIYSHTDSRRIRKAMLIGQYLRSYFGTHLADIVPSTGYRRPR